MDVDRLTTVETETRAVGRLVVRLVNLMVAATTVGMLLAPLVRITPSDDGDPTAVRSLRQLLDFILGDTEDLTSLYGREAEGYGSSLTVTALALRIGLILVVVAGISLVFVSLSLIASSSPRHRVIVNITAGVLLASALLVAAAAAVLPVDDGGAGPAWGVWLPIFAALLVLVLPEPASDLDR